MRILLSKVRGACYAQIIMVIIIIHLLRCSCRLSFYNSVIIIINVINEALICMNELSKNINLKGIRINKTLKKKPNTNLKSFKYLFNSLFLKWKWIRQSKNLLVVTMLDELIKKLTHPFIILDAMRQRLNEIILNCYSYFVFVLNE